MMTSRIIPLIKIRMILRITAATLLTCSLVCAETITWSNTAGGLWNSAANWTPAKIPAPGDDVIIHAAGSNKITVTTDASISSLTLGTGSELVLGSGTLALKPVIPPPVMYTLAITRSGDGSGTVTSSPAGIDCGTGCSAPFSQSSIVTLMAQAAAGSTFTGWSGGCSGVAACYATLNAPVAISAEFKHAVYGNLSAAGLGAGANLNGALPFPADNPWNTDISTSPVDPNSSAIIAAIGLATGLHPDFGSGLYDGAPIGIPYVVVAGSQPKVPMLFGDYADESDPGPYPVPPNAPIEGQKADGSPFDGDRHVLVIDRDANRLYELGNAYPQSNGSWQASGGALFHLDSNNVRPGGQPGWTSADAAGLPIFPGLARYEEAASGVIRHALRFTVSTTRKAYVPPATHWASSTISPDRPPMGMRVRLKAGYVIPANYSKESKSILQALKTYGMFVADNGSNWYISGAPDDRWNNDNLVRELGSVKGSNFEVLRMDGLVTP